jgi:YVTN family beta-propeller protein
MPPDSPPALSARPWRSIGLALALVLPVGGSLATAGPVSPSTAVQNGISVEFSLLPAGPDKPGSDGMREGQEATFRFRITNADSRSPLKEASPAAWVTRQATRHPSGKPLTSVEKAAPFLGGATVMRQADLDLNSYRVVVMNREATLSVLDPLLHLASSRLLTFVLLPSPASDWVLTPDQRTIFVSLPESNAVAAVDTEKWEVSRMEKNLPGCSRVLLQPDKGYLWVTYSEPDSGRGGVAVLQPETLRRVATIETGAGPHTVAFRPDSRFAFVANAGSGTVSVVDIAALSRIKDVKTGSRPGGAAFSSAGDMLYVPDSVDGTVSRIDGARLLLAGRIDLDPGIGELAFEPRGRYGLLLNPKGRKIHVIDAADGRVIQTGVTEAESKADATRRSEPFQIAFSTKLAYILDRTSESVFALPLDQIGHEGKPIALAEIPAGRSPLGAGPRNVHACMLVESPDSGAVLFANPKDAAIYYYQEGMAAAKGSFDNARREALAVMVVNHGLREVAPGVYETTGRLGRPGVYDVIFSLASPTLIHAFELKVAPDPALESQSNPLAEVHPPSEAKGFTVGQNAILRFGVTRRGSKEPVDGVKDMQILIRHTGSNWERHTAAQSLGSGVYGVEFLPPAAGNYRISFASESLRLAFQATPWADIQVERAP